MWPKCPMIGEEDDLQGAFPKGNSIKGCFLEEERIFFFEGVVGVKM